MDSFESVANYEGKLANIVLTKDGPLQTILLQPYLRFFVLQYRRNKRL
ncbi:MAG: hypothetical protein U5J96_18065 [Ignavibacteriaceae bacterium]|nr:hypothetical protein [Ignavibacteriaceae bacterium]